MKSTRREIITTGLMFAAASATRSARVKPIAPSPQWTNAMPSAPMPATKITEQYAALVGRDAFLGLADGQCLQPPAGLRKGPRNHALGTGTGGPTQSARHAVRFSSCPKSESSPVQTRTLFTGSVRLRSTNPPWSFRCPISASGFGSIRLSICAPTALPISARCMALRPDFICYPGRTGKAKSPRELPRSFAPRPIPGMSSRACFKTTVRKTIRPFKASPSRS